MSDELIEHVVTGVDGPAVVEVGPKRKGKIAACLTSERSTWQTPPAVLDLVRQFAPIGLDPCTDETNPTGAKAFFTAGDDGLLATWAGFGLVFVNPPYGRSVGEWVRKCASEAVGETATAEIIALLPSRTDSNWFQTWVLRQASAILWWKGRITFVGAAAGAPFPSALVYYGGDVDRFERVMSGAGVVTCL